MAQSNDKSKAEEATGNPWIAVTQRAFSFMVPGEIYGAKGRKAPSGEAQVAPVMITTELGITFLAAEVSVFALLHHPAGQVVSLPPPTHSAQMRIGAPTLLSAPEFMGRDRKPKFAAIEAAHLKAFRHLGWGSTGEFSYDDPDRSRFLVEPGATSQDIQILRVSELFGATEAGFNAIETLMRLAPHFRNEAHAGALHDHCLAAGANGIRLATAIRRRARQCSWGPK